jgi:hypothetical protein
MIVAVIGGGTAPAKVIKTGLQELVEEASRHGKPTFLVEWRGAPPEDGPGSAYEHVYDFLLDAAETGDITMDVYYDGDEYRKPPRMFKGRNCNVHEFADEADFVHDLSLESNLVDSASVIAYLWDDEIGGDRYSKHPDVRDLTNGLVPLTPPKPAVPAPVEEETAAEDDGDESFTKQELQDMPAAVVKRYGAKMGCASVTKGAIIEELFPDHQAGIVDSATTLPVEATDVPHVLSESDLTAEALLELAIKRMRSTVSREVSLAITKTQEALLWLRSGYGDAL